MYRLRKFNVYVYKKRFIINNLLTYCDNKYYSNQYNTNTNIKLSVHNNNKVTRIKKYHVIIIYNKIITIIMGNRINYIKLHFDINNMTFKINIYEEETFVSNHISTFTNVDKYNRVFDYFINYFLNYTSKYSIKLVNNIDWSVLF